MKVTHIWPTKVTPQSKVTLSEPRIDVTLLGFTVPLQQRHHKTNESNNFQFYVSSLRSNVALLKVTPMFYGAVGATAPKKHKSNDRLPKRHHKKSNALQSNATFYGWGNSTIKSEK